MPPRGISQVSLRAAVGTDSLRSSTYSQRTEEDDVENRRIFYMMVEANLYGVVKLWRAQRLKRL
jgi:hypothetical protein